MVKSIQTMLTAAHEHSRDNRKLLQAGRACGCFHCLKTFMTSEVVQWGGKDNNTALCPFCHYDAVLSADTDPIDADFLQRMQSHYFGERIKLDLSGELAKLQGAGSP